MAYANPFNCFSFFRHRPQPAGLPEGDPAMRIPLYFDDFVLEVKDLPEYRRLLQLTDAESVRLTLLSCWCMLLKQKYGMREEPAHPERACVRTDYNEFKQFVPPFVAGMLDAEFDSVGGCVLFFCQLLGEARRNVAHDLLSNPGNREEPGQYGAADWDKDVVKAAKWIFSSSNSLKEDDTTQTWLSHIAWVLDNVLRREMDLLDPRTLQYIHQKLHPNSGPKTRSPRRDVGVKYPGTGGGRYLQKLAAEMANRLPKAIHTPHRRFQVPNSTNTVFIPQPHLDNWANVACFLYGAHIRAHAFADGNGRAVRVLYACAMMKSDHGFVAPSLAFSSRLSGM